MNPGGVYIPSAPGLPTDDFEWKMQAFWWWLLSFLSFFGVYGTLRVMTLWDFAAAFIGGPFAFMWAILLAAFGSFTVIKLRRLYIYVYPRRDPRVTTAIVSALLGGLILTGEITMYNARRFAEETPDEVERPIYR